MKLVDQLNGVLDLFSVGPYKPAEDKAYRVFGLNPEHSLMLLGDNVAKFDLSLERMLNQIANTSGTLSIEEFTELLLPLVREKRMAGSHFSEDESNSFLDRLSEIPVREYRVLRTLHGAELEAGRPPLALGAFTVYDPRTHESQIFKGSRRSLNFPQRAQQTGLLIECAVHAKDGTKAMQVADARFYRFELIFRVLIGRRAAHVEVGVLNYVGPRLQDRLVIVEDELASGSAWKGALQPLQLADPFFSNPAPPLKRLLGLISNQRNPLEARVLRCAEWTGEAIGDPNAASALVKAATALEVLFSINEKGPITPSIMSQIAEGCAFVLGASPENAGEIERKVRDLYGVRSAVVHSGKDTVNSHDLDTFIHICRSVVLALLSKEEFMDIESAPKLAEHLRRMKYASVKLPGNNS